jgi:RNA polymerase sigma-70 factor (ECF subfamily)
MDLVRCIDPADTAHPTAFGRIVTWLDEEYTRFYRTEYAAVARTVYLILHDRQRAEDVAQEAFVRLLEHWRKVSTYDRPDAWVRRVAIRIAVKGLKRERVRASLERDVEPPTPPAPIDVDLMRAVGRLPAEQRAAIVLFYFEDRPIAEIVDVLGCTESAAKVWLHRARRRLADLLGEEVHHDAP